MTPAWMQPPNDVDKYVSDYCGGGYTDPWQPDDWPDNQAETGENQMPTHAQRIAQIEEQFESDAPPPVLSACIKHLHHQDSETANELAQAIARIATLERQVARLLEAVPQAGLAGDRAFYVDSGGPGPRK